MDKQFTYSGPPHRVGSGSGAIDACANEIGTSGVRKPLS
jgi:hypothetical protein